MTEKLESPRSIVESLRQQQAAKTLDAQNEYRKILARADDPQPKDAATLQRLADTLNLSADDVAADVAALAVVASHTAAIIPPDRLKTLDDAVADAAAKVHEFYSVQEQQRIAAETKLSLAKSAAQNAYGTNRDAQKAIAAAKASRPMAFDKVTR
jgi:predicted PhzF superfamily epimerase YddE/YHI9